MKGYRKLSGDYIELHDTTPVGASLVQVVLRPSPLHVFAATWATDPLDPAICWRLKTTTELNSEKDSDLQTFLDTAGGRALKAVALLCIEKGLFAMVDLRAKYRSL